MTPNIRDGRSVKSRARAFNELGIAGPFMSILHHLVWLRLYQHRADDLRPTLALTGLRHADSSSSGWLPSATNVAGEQTEAAPGGITGAEGSSSRLES
jgi:hypothetical protein